MANSIGNNSETQNSQSRLSQLPVSLKQAIMSFGMMSVVSGDGAQAQTPKFMDEPANSPKISNVVADQKAILDMLPATNPSRPAVETAIKSLADGGSIEELTNLFMWASAINNSPSAPPAAKEKAKNILKTLTVDPTGVVPNTAQAGKPVAKKPEPPIGGYTKEQLKRKQWEENTMKNANGVLSNAQAVTYNTSDTAVASLKIIGNTRVFTVNSKEKNPKSGTPVKATANFAIKGLPAGTSVSYTLPVPENMNRKAKKVGSVRIIFVNQNGKAINTDGKEEPAFFLSVESDKTKQFVMPPTATGITEKIDLPLEFDTANGVYPEQEFRVGTGVIEIMPTPEGTIVDVVKK